MGYGARSALKTTEFKNYADGVEEGVMMTALDCNRLLFIGDGSAAGGAKQGLLRCCLRAGGRLLAWRAWTARFEVNAIEQRGASVAVYPPGNKQQWR